MKSKSLINLMLTLGILLALQATFPTPDSARAQEPPPPDAAALQSSDWWTQARAYIRQREYHLSSLQEEDGYTAPNRAQNLRFTFRPDGLQAMDRTEGESAWVWGLALNGLGRDGAVTLLAAPTLNVHENRITYHRGELTEEYTNSASGLEQRLTLTAPPSTSNRGAALSIELALSGDLTPHRLADGGLAFRQDGEPILHYGGLQATDTTGRQLAAHLALPPSLEGAGINIVVDDASATYPIHIQARITGLPTAPDWSIQGDQDTAYMGWSVATAGDVNGDSYSDVIVGLPFYDGSATESGIVFVYHGSASGLPTLPNWTLNGVQAYAQLGYSVATAGDVNGDGYSDVIIGAPDYDNGEENEGQAYVYHGSASGLSPTASWTSECNQEWAYFGASVATAGDVNGDGYSDVIIGASGYDALTYDDDRGMACVYYGSSSGLGEPLSPPWCEFGSDDDASYGSSVATAGDVNGDGYADIIVGAPGYSFAYPNGGRALVYHGSSSGPGSASAWDVMGPESARLGASVSMAGDVNGDGYADVIVGVPEYSNGQYEEGQVRVYHGSSSGLPDNPNWTVESDLEYTRLGSSAATAGDVNGDGYGDVIVGAPDYTNGQGDEGQTRVYHGSNSGLPSTANWVTESNAGNAAYGWSVATAGDVNGDGYSDILIGAPYYTYDQTCEGVTFAFYGGPDTLSQTAGWAYESDYADKGLGRAVSTAGDVNGDGYADILVGAPYYDSGETDEGAVFVWHGSAYGPGVSPDWSAYGDQNDAHLGYSVATAGDVNGDGYADVIVGAPHYDNGEADEGSAFVWQGSGSGLGGDGTPGGANWRAESNQAGATLGWSVATAGDVNGDGYTDVAIGAPNYANGQTSEGVVFAWYGDSGGLGANGTPNNADWQDEGDADNGVLGTSVSTAGDVNRDGYSDLIAGGNNFAAAWHGSSTGLRPSGTDWFKSEIGSYGASVSTAGDVNGDGYADVIVGAPLYNSSQGSAWAYCGSSGGLPSSACWVDAGGLDWGWFGWSVATAGDLNGDGYADIVVGAPMWSNPDPYEGHARIYYGSSLGPVSYNGGDWTREGNLNDAYLGWSVATAGDVNGDGYADLLLGAPGYTNGQIDEGQASLYYGNGGPSRPLLPRQLRTGTTTPISPLGLSDSQTAFRIQGTGHTPTGRGEFAFQWEVKPLSTPFDGSGVQSTAWLDTGLSGLTVQETIGSLSAGTPYHWRARLRYNLITNPFNPPYSRWFHMPWNGWNEADLRTAGGGTVYNYHVYLPLAQRDY